jgi:hypothetical protein
VTIGAAVGVAASWVKAVSERRLQGVFERVVQPGDGFGQFTGGLAELDPYRPARDEAAAARVWDVWQRHAGVEFAAV